MVTNYRIDRCVDSKAFFEACFELDNAQPVSPVRFITDDEEELIVTIDKVTRLGRIENLNFRLSGTIHKVGTPKSKTGSFSGYYNAKCVNRQGVPKTGLVGAFTANY